MNTDTHTDQDAQKGRPVATRNIEIRTFEGTEGRLAVEGTLIDNRHIDFTGFSGKTIEPGRYHTLKARMEISLDTMKIEEIAVSFIDYPHNECIELRDSYRSLIGLNVERGFTRAVLERVGSPKACAHITHLIITMGPAIVQAAFTYQRRAESSWNISKEQIQNYFVDSCYVWRADGPYAQKNG
ncbi:MAG: DUF2889 domain-containing protein [Spirochaetaceae bacterium]